MVATHTDSLTRRNYVLDFLKLIFTFLVFFSHTSEFIGINTTISIPPLLGATCVHFFYIISGMMMIKSLSKYKGVDECGKNALNFIVRKFKNLLPGYWIALAITLIIHIYVYLRQGNVRVFSELMKFYPEIFALQYGGTFYNINPFAWYISSMLICMLPLSYLCLRHRDFYVYVFAPTTAILTFSYLVKTYNYFFGGTDDFNGLVIDGIIRAVCGICFGAISYLVLSKFNEFTDKKKNRITLTIVELVLWGVFFYSLLIERDRKVTMCGDFLILPTAIAVTTSGKSYVSDLFRFKWMKHLSSLSLAIYLCHRAAVRIVMEFFPDGSYKLCTSLMILFTALICVLYYIIIFIIKKISEKRKTKKSDNTVNVG